MLNGKLHGTNSILSTRLISHKPHIEVRLLYNFWKVFWPMFMVRGKIHFITSKVEQILFSLALFTAKLSLSQFSLKWITTWLVHTPSKNSQPLMNALNFRRHTKESLIPCRATSSVWRRACRKCILQCVVRCVSGHAVQIFCHLVKYVQCNLTTF